MRAVLLGLLVAGISGAGVFFWMRTREAKSDGTSLNGTVAARSTTSTVERGDVNFTVSVAGEIGPAEQVSVRPEVNGRINELPVDVGDHVSKGGLLFALDDRDLRIELETREKEIESAKLQLDKARLTMEQTHRDFVRDKELFEAKLLSEQEYENSRQRFDASSKDHDLARNSIERTDKELDLAKERLQKTRIQAPFDCTVLTRPVSVGQAVSGSGGFNSGTEVLTIADLSSMIISAHINQADVTHLTAGMDVSVQVDAVPGLTLRGNVERIAPQATIKNNLKGYATRIALKKVETRVQPGMTATLSIPVATAENVLTVPLAAVFNELGEHYVLVKTNATYERRSVTVGVSDFFNAEIKNGLSAGDIVALEDPGGMAGRVPGAGPGFTQGGARPAGLVPGNGSLGARPTGGAPGGNRPVTNPGSTGARPSGARPGT